MDAKLSFTARNGERPTETGFVRRRGPAVTEAELDVLRYSGVLHSRPRIRTVEPGPARDEASADAVSAEQGPGPV